jgi:hypothetical protein
MVPVDTTDVPVIRYHNRSFVNFDKAVWAIMSVNVGKYVTEADAAWSVQFGADRNKWPFNTQCCASKKYPRMAQC